MCNATCFELIPDSYGQYIPQTFAEQYGSHCQNVKDGDISILRTGPEHPEYWEAWNDVERDAILVGNDGTRYTLYQDSNLYAIKEGADIPDYLTGF